MSRDGRITDAWVVHDWSTTSDLAPYLSEGWKGILLPRIEHDHWGGPTRVRAHPLYTNPLGSKRPDSYPESGVPGSSIAQLQSVLLDSGRADRVVLGYDEAVLTTAFPEVHAAAAVVRAANDWTVEEWLERDPRMHGTILVVSGIPDEASAEIRRLGSNEQMVAVALGANSLGNPFGHPVYHPIYEAAVELDLPIVLQTSSDLAATLATPPVAGGLPFSYGEYWAWSGQSLMSHAASLICRGVFETFPTLRVLLVGGGATWLPGYLWRLDFWFKMHHQDAPWATRLPSAYFREHIWVSTYQLERSPSPSQLEQALGTLPWLPSRLVYASGYPNVDSDEPETIAARLPAGWHSQVFDENADALFRWPRHAKAEVAGGAELTAARED